MNHVIISCKTIENELLAAMKETNCQYEVRWIESGLHNVPKKLHRKLQEMLDGCEGADTVLLAMGLCGNSVQGLTTGSFQLVVPRVDDCISLLLGSTKTRTAFSRQTGAYFLTDGWLKGERNIWKEYEYTRSKYGEELGQEIFDAMFSHYRTLALVDTGCYDLAPAEKEARRIADHLKLDYALLPGTLSYLETLLQRQWAEEQFILVPPHSELTDTRL